MKPETVLRRLLNGEEAVPVLWDAMLSIWGEGANPADVDGYIRTREKLICDIERALETTYWEVYAELMNQADAAAAPWTGADAQAVIVVDGMSLREACLLQPVLAEAGYTVESVSYSFSAIPSDTGTFRKKFFGVTLPDDLAKKGVVYVDPPAKPGPEFFPHTDPLFVWLRYPDKGLHQEGDLPSEVFVKTKTYLLQVLERSQRQTFLLVSDHGYIYGEDADHVLNVSRDLRSKFKEVYKGGRFVKPDDTMPAVVRERSLTHGDLCLVRGRYLWTVKGKRVFHGGVSPMECLTPVLKVRRQA